MKRTRIARRSRRVKPVWKPIARKPIKRKKRSAGEFARIYHSKARVEWVKSLACMACLNFKRSYVTPSENAHVCGNDGMGRKAGYETIVPLCAGCHRRYDRRLKPFDADWIRERVQSWAPKIEATWQARSGGPEHISSVVARVMDGLDD